MNMFKKKINIKFITFLLCVKKKNCKLNKYLIRYIYEMCNYSVKICDIFQSSLYRPSDFANLISFEFDHYYSTINFNLVFYREDFKPIKPRLNMNDPNFSFFIDRKKYLPSFIYLFIFDASEKLNNFCSVSRKDYSIDGRIPSLSLQEQKHFLKYLF